MTTAEVDPRTQQPREPLKRMSFGDHLEELRRRVAISFVAILAAMLPMFLFKTEVTGIYIQPYERMWMEAYITYADELAETAAVAAAAGETLHETVQRKVEFNADYYDEIVAGTFPKESYGDIEVVGGFPLSRTLKALGGLDDFWVFMAAAALFGLLLSLPVVLYQIWAFVAAGLYKEERHVVLRHLPLAVGLTVTGVLFGYFVVVPTGLYFLIRLMDFGMVTPLLGVSQYFSFLFSLTAALGFVFQMPLLMLAINRVGLVSGDAMRKNWRYIVLGFFVVAAMVTPPDPFTQVMMAIPMIVLYLLGLLLVGRAERRSAAATAGAPA